MFLKVHYHFTANKTHKSKLKKKLNLSEKKELKEDEIKHQ